MPTPRGNTWRCCEQTGESPHLGITLRYRKCSSGADLCPWWLPRNSQACLFQDPAGPRLHSVTLPFCLSISRSFSAYLSVYLSVVSAHPYWSSSVGQRGRGYSPCEKSPRQGAGRGGTHRDAQGRFPVTLGTRYHSHLCRGCSSTEDSTQHPVGARVPFSYLVTLPEPCDR